MAPRITKPRTLALDRICRVCPSHASLLCDKYVSRHDRVLRYGIGALRSTVACHPFCAPISPTLAKEVAHRNANPLFRPRTCSWSFYLRSTVFQTHKRKKKAVDKCPGLAVDSADLLDFTVLGSHIK